MNRRLAAMPRSTRRFAMRPNPAKWQDWLSTRRPARSGCCSRARSSTTGARRLVRPSRRSAGASGASSRRAGSPMSRSRSGSWRTNSASARARAPNRGARVREGGESRPAPVRRHGPSATAGRALTPNAARRSSSSKAGCGRRRPGASCRHGAESERDRTSPASE